MDYSNHAAVIAGLQKAQEADHDNRERARESQKFLAARDGQWEPEWADQAKNKPQYTFDMVEPVIDQIMGDIAMSDFDIRTMPAGGESSEDTADTYNGLLRNIAAQSNADEIHDRVTRNTVIHGFDAARVITKYCTGESFDQDIALEAIPNAIDRVWFGYHNEPDASDADHCWILTGIPEGDYKERFPRAPEASIEADRQSNVFFHKPGLVMIGELVYMKAEKTRLVKLSDGRVMVDDEDYQKLKDELKAAGITEVDDRESEIRRAYSRRFTRDAWIDDKPRKLVFKHWLPVVPSYGTFEVIDEKIVYRGAVEKLIDAQRVLNYSLSREIEEGALAPRAKYWMTRAQAEGEEDTLGSLNTNTDPVQFYTPDPKAPGAPQQNGGATINPGLRNISEAMQAMIGTAAGMFAANMGDNPGLQSGVAIEALQDRGDRANNKFVKARECFERQLCRVILHAIPEVYLPDRQIRLLGQDGAVEIATIGQQILDTQTQKPVTLHDVSRGSYDVTVIASPSFQSRQSETVKAITDLAVADPTLIEMGGDILLANIPTPGMDDLAARKRAQLFNAGAIPYDQMTIEEQQQYEAMQNAPQEESPEMVLARAEQAKADAEAQKAQADFLAEQNKSQEIANRFTVESQKASNDAARLKLDAFLAEFEAEKAGLEGRKIYADVVKTIAEAEKIEAETDATVTNVTEALRPVGGVQ